jgi:hypothetical protein
LRRPGNDGRVPLGMAIDAKRAWVEVDAQTWHEKLKTQRVLARASIDPNTPRFRVVRAARA